MRLNYDTLIIVMSFSSRKNALCLAYTCRTLYRAGISCILKRGIYVDTRARIVSFCHFMLRDHSRFRSLYSLFLTDDEPSVALDQKTEELVATMFKHASYLDELIIQGTQFVCGSGPVCRAIAKLPSLSELHLNQEVHEISQMLREIKAPVKQVTIRAQDHHPLPNERLNILSVLGAMKDSLEDLYFERVYAAPWVDIQFPKVTSMIFNDGVSLETPPLIHSFPNLRYLTIMLADSHLPWEFEAAEFDQIVRRNIEEQKHERWETLSQLSSNIQALRTFRIQSKVEYLDLYAEYMVGEERDHFFNVLSDTRPTRLAFMCEEPNFSLPKLGNVLSPVLGTLEALRLGIRFHGRKYKKLGPVLKALATTLSQFPLRILCLHIDWSPHLDHIEPQTSRVKAPQHLDSEDLEPLARMIKSIIPSLRYIYLQMSPKYGDVEEMWADSDTPGEGQGQLVELSEDEVERVMDEFFENRVQEY